VILAGAFGARLWVESGVLLNSMLAIDMRFNRMHIKRVNRASGVTNSFICVDYPEPMTRNNVSHTLCPPDMAIKTRDGPMMGESGIGADIEPQGVMRAGNGANTMTG
jgi:hypothetical protein